LCALAPLAGACGGFTIDAAAPSLLLLPFPADACCADAPRQTLTHVATAAARSAIFTAIDACCLTSIRFIRSLPGGIQAAK
jgi:hypothetical protein